MYICQAPAASRHVAVGPAHRGRSRAAQVREDAPQGPPQVRWRDPLLRLARPGVLRDATNSHACVRSLLLLDLRPPRADAHTRF